MGRRLSPEDRVLLWPRLAKISLTPVEKAMVLRHRGEEIQVPLTARRAALELLLRAIEDESLPERLRVEAAGRILDATRELAVPLVQAAVERGYDPGKMLLDLGLVRWQDGQMVDMAQDVRERVEALAARLPPEPVVEPSDPWGDGEPGIGA